MTTGSYTSGYTTGGGDASGDSSDSSGDSSEDSSSESTTGYDLTTSTTSINPNSTTGGGDLTTGSTSTTNTSDATSGSSTTGGGVGTPSPTTGTAVEPKSKFNVRVEVSGNTTIDNALRQRFAGAIASAFNVTPGQVSDVVIEFTNVRTDAQQQTRSLPDAQQQTRSLPHSQQQQTRSLPNVQKHQTRDTQHQTRSLRTRGTKADGGMLCTATVNFEVIKTPEETVELQTALNTTENPVAKFFSELNTTIVVVNVTYVKPEPPAPTLSGISSTGSLSLGFNVGSPKANINNIAVPVGIVVPAVVILGAAGSFLFIKYRRNRRAAHRAEHWDMHNMYSGLSMVNYA